MCTNILIASRPWDIPESFFVKHNLVAFLILTIISIAKTDVQVECENVITQKFKVRASTFEYAWSFVCLVCVFNESAALSQIATHSNIVT